MEIYHIFPVLKTIIDREVGTPPFVNSLLHFLRDTYLTQKKCRIGVSVEGIKSDSIKIQK